MKLAEHVRQICRERGIRIKPALRGSLGNAHGKTILIRSVTNEASYAIALHEIGHTIVGYRKPILLQEAEAWDHAKRLALRWTPTMQRACLEGLLSYVARAHDAYRRGVPTKLKLPPLDHVFWQLVQGTKEGDALHQFGTADWLHPTLAVVPWGSVLSHPARPRCSNCEYWSPLARIEGEQLEEKQQLGLCLHRSVPLGVETTPGGALCGSAWTSAVYLPLAR